MGRCVLSLTNKRGRWPEVHGHGDAVERDPSNVRYPAVIGASPIQVKRRHPTHVGHSALRTPRHFAVVQVE